MTRHQRTKEAALLLPIVGFLLLMPPLLSIFGGPVLVFGLPILPTYIFFVWLLLIVAGALLSRRLEKSAPPEHDGDRERVGGTEPRA